MAYQLTEIALELMGFKFYDIHGNYRPMNFATTETPPADCQEPNLITAMGLQKPLKIKQKVKKDDAKVTVGGNTRSTVDNESKEFAFKSEDTNDLPNISATKLFDDEMKGLKKEFMLNKIQYMDDHIKASTKKKKTLKTNIFEQKALMAEHLHDIGKFCNNVEKVFEKLDSGMFQKYKEKLEELNKSCESEEIEICQPN